MALYADLAEEIVQEAAGCPALVLERLMQTAAADFCRSSRIYQLFGTVSTVAEQAEYDLSGVLPANTKITKPMWVKADGYRIGASNPRNADDTLTPYVSEYYVEGGILTLFGTPSKVQEIEYLLALSPTSTATEIDDAIAEDWGAAIKYLTLAHAFSLFDKSWSDHTMAGHYSQLYAAELQLARRRSTHNHMPRRKNVRFSW